jgi:hypothetical protein
METATTVAQSAAILVYKVRRLQQQFSRIPCVQGRGMEVALVQVENRWEEEKLRVKEAKEERVVIGMGHVVKGGKGYLRYVIFTTNTEYVIKGHY